MGVVLVSEVEVLALGQSVGSGTESQVSEGGFYLVIE